MIFKMITCALLTLTAWTNAKAENIVLHTRSTQQRDLTLEFASENVTRQTHTGILCTHPEATISTVKLWMPMHGHGSTPTTLTPSQTAGCSDISRINFTMLGEWEIRVKFSDGDDATFDVEVN